MTENIYLDGYWEFRFDPEDRGKRDKWFLKNDLIMGMIPVPGTWQGNLGVEEQQVGWYKKKFNLQSEYANKIIFLEIGAADYLCECWLNGIYLGKHYGGHTSFRFDLTDSTVFGKNNTLFLRVVDVNRYKPRHLEITGSKVSSNLPPGQTVDPGGSLISRGKQFEYREVSGIWQSVKLLIRNRVYLEDIFVIPDIDESRIKVKFRIVNRSIEEVTVNVRSTIRAQRDSPDLTSTEKKVKISSGSDLEEEVQLKLDTYNLWELDNPFLYMCLLEVFLNKRTTDSAMIRFGMKKVEVKNGWILLNNRKLFIKGSLNQGFHPRSIYYAMSREEIEDEVKKHKLLGLNLIRFHLKPFQPEFLDVADELGILIWEETAIGWAYPWFYKGQGPLSYYDIALNEFLDMIKRDRNHPSVIIWGVTNENRMAASHYGERFMEETYRRGKELDPTRLIMDNSDPIGFGTGDSKYADFRDHHFYRDVPENVPLEGKSALPSWNPPTMESEVGIWGYPFPDGLTDEYYYDSLFKDLEEQFRSLGLDAIFEDIQDLVRESQEHQFMGLKYWMEDLRKNPTVTGYVLTQSYDLYEECNGLMDFNRKLKIFYKKYELLQRPILPILDWKTHNYWSECEFKAKAKIVHFKEANIKNASLSWETKHLGKKIVDGSFEEVKLHPYTVETIGEVTFQIPKVSDESKIMVELSISSQNEQFKNSWVFYAYPRTLMKEVSATVAYNGKNSSLKDKWLKPLNKATDVLITERFNQNTKEYVSSGGKIILLVTEEMKIGKIETLRLFGRHKFSFVKGKHPIFKNFNNLKRLDWRFHALLPRRLLRNVAKPIIGYFREFKYLGSAMVELKYGRGKILATTLNFTHIDEDPASQILMSDMISHILSNEFQPNQTI